MTPRIQTIKTPQHYVSYEAYAKTGKKLPETLPVWAAQNGVDEPGSVVTAPDSFQREGDHEALVMAINETKGIDSPVVWRRENYLVWGFYGTPDKYTEDGRKLFLNCLTYIAKRR